MLINDFNQVGVDASRIRVTAGEKTGSVLCLSDREGKRSLYVIPVAAQHSTAEDTTGAGDAFAAGFLYGFIKGKEPTECGRLGDIVARFSLTLLGARQDLPGLSQLTRRYQELYQKPL